MIENLKRGSSLTRCRRSKKSIASEIRHIRTFFFGVLIKRQNREKTVTRFVGGRLFFYFFFFNYVCPVCFHREIQFDRHKCYAIEITSLLNWWIRFNRTAPGRTGIMGTRKKLETERKRSCRSFLTKTGTWLEKKKNPARRSRTDGIFLLFFFPFRLLLLLL